MSPSNCSAMGSSNWAEWWERRANSEEDLDELVAAHFQNCLEARSNELAEDETRGLTHGGSKIGRSPNLTRDHSAGHSRIWADYFNPNPTYPPNIFRRRFRMQRSLFLRIHDNLVQSAPYFVQKPDALGNCGLSSTQKMIAALRMFTLGIAADAVDEYVRIGESTAMKCFKSFAKGIVRAFGEEYLRSPTEADVTRQLQINSSRGFPGMFGSLDCTHWTWKNCLVSLQGAYRDKNGDNTKVMEAIATHNLWIWHAFYGIPGSANDINIMDKSPLLTDLLAGVMPRVEFRVNNQLYTNFYLLTDGIYPDLSVFVKTISSPQGAKNKLFASRQEALWKDVERCFGVLQARFVVVRNPARLWSQSTLVLIWKCAVILHNMIVEDEESERELNQEYLFESEPPRFTQGHASPLNFQRFSEGMQRLHDSTLATNLQTDLVEHLWRLKGDE